MGREDDYTGSHIGDDDSDYLPADVDLYEFDADDEDNVYYDDLGENEQELRFSAVADGATTLQSAATKLYDLADELLVLVEDGWELLDDVTDGRAVAVRFTEIEFEDEDEDEETA